MFNMSTPTRKRRAMGQNIGAADKPNVQAAFIQAFRDIGIIRRAAEKAGVDRSLIHYWRENDSAFADAFELAEQDANDVIRSEIYKRAISGWIETVTTVEVDSEGNTTTKTVKSRKYSDAMLRLIAMSRMAEFRDRLDMATAGEQLGAYRAIASIADDPIKAQRASDLLRLIAGPSNNTSGLVVDSEPG